MPGLMYLEPTDESFGRLLGRGITGSVTMLNLLRFRQDADYSEHPELAPAEPITGSQAYDRYAEHTLPFLATVGGELRLMGASGANLIGPTDERWDVVMLVRYPSLEAFMDMAQNDDYRAGMGHRTAALEDSRLLPIVEFDRS